MNYTLASFAIAFLLTNAIEFPTLHFLLKKPIKLKFTALIITNSITVPIAWLIFPFFFGNYLIGFALIEATVIVAETFLLKLFLKEGIKKAFVASLAMNLLSAAVGLIL